MEQLKKAYEAIEMLKALDLPVSEEQLTGVAKLEKEYLQKEIIPLLKQELEPLVTKMRSPFYMDITYNMDKGLEINLEDYMIRQAPVNSMKQSDSVSMRDVTRYSIDGGEPLKKRRFVLAVVKKYIESHSKITYDELRRRFPDRLSNSPLHGVFRPLDNILDKLDSQPDLAKRFFLDDDDLIELSDGTIITVYNQWGTSFSNFLEVAKQLHKVESFSNS